MRRNEMRLMAAIPFLVFSLAFTVAGQTKSPVTPPDYGQFENLSTVAARGGLSPDGKWMVYGINRSDRNNELRIANVADGTTKVAAFGAQPVFSADSRWLAYAIGYSETQEDKLRKDRKPIQRKLGLLNLTTGETTVVDAVESFAFNASGSHLAMRRYAPERKEPEPPPADGDEALPSGATLILRQLASGRDATFGNVVEFAWQNKGRLLAFTLSSEDKTLNGVQLFDPETGSLRVLDSSGSTYVGLGWRKDAADLTVLRSKPDEQHEGATQIALAWTHLTDSSEKRHEYDPTADKAFSPGLRLVSFRRPSWSDDGGSVFLGAAKWTEKPPAAKPGAAAAPAPAAPAETEEPADVDIWHSGDVDVMPKQKIGARGDRQKNMLAVWSLENNRLIQLGKELAEQVTPLKRQKLAYAANWSAYAMDRSIGRPAADIHLVDLTTGERTRIKERLPEDDYLQSSPNGRYLLYLLDDHYWTVDTATRTMVNITKNIQTSFVDRGSDATIKQKPAFGVAGWTKNDESVILYDQFDAWKVSSDGSRAVRLTDGAAEQVRHRYVRLNPEEEWIDPDKPLYFSLFGIWTKKSGYGRLSPGMKQVERLVWLDKSVTRLAKAKDADVYQYVIESFEDSPDSFVGGADLKDAKQVTKTNPFQDRYSWGRSELVEYKNEQGERLQGALYYPADYQPGKRYPMIVYMYERLSDGLHRFVPPGERDPYNTSVFNGHGYFVLQPDIAFRKREPGLSVADCVGAAVKKVVQMGLVDEKKVGIVGHSWGGYDTTFLATHTDMFAAAVAGAPITNLISNYGNHHWNQGIAETDHIETGQQRMEVPLYEDLPAYIRNSAVFGVQNMKTPLMIEVGDSDGVVFWHQGVELYNIARRAKKNVVLLVYAGEDHGLRRKPNQLDYHRRIVQWFGHYLKDKPAPSWITNGRSFIDREQELKRLKTRK